MNAFSKALDGVSMTSPRLRSLFLGVAPLPRPAYLALLLGVSLVKVVTDVSIGAALGVSLHPLQSFEPLFAARIGHQAAPWPASLLVASLATTLAFLWLGVCLSGRRALDAGLTPWLGAGFLLPWVNGVLVALLLVLPTRAAARPRPGPPVAPVVPVARALAVGVGLVAATAAAMGVLAVLTENLHAYGEVLFLGLPFVLGTVAGFLYNLPRERTIGATLGMIAMVLLFGFLLLLGFALEGVICLAMAYPIVGTIAGLGALVGRAMAKAAFAPGPSFVALVLLLPVSGWLESRLESPAAREVRTAVEVDAPPEVVWGHVIRFSELPEPEGWLFRTGIAYPLRARLEGAGVGAVRYCEFTTGPFVEPITVWDAPRRLAFDVVEQPVAMEEWSFYAHVHPPHLDESFRSVRGEFRLTPLPGGRTRLEGRTWYELDLGPVAYWQLWSDAILHRIHQRVLNHVRREAERAVRER